MKPVPTLIATAGLALLVACFPDPASNGAIPKTSAQQLGVSGSRFQGQPVFNLVPAGITHSATHSPPVSDKMAECGRLDPASVGLESH